MPSNLYTVTFADQSTLPIVAEFDARLIVWNHAKIRAKVKSMEVVKIERKQ
jgi:hypothetical protein